MKTKISIKCKLAKDRLLHIMYRKKYPWKSVFSSIKQRCNNPKTKQYKHYGKRGIKCLITEDEVKQLWYRDKAYKMKCPSIDRKENNDNYCLENCRFIEFAENVAERNIRVCSKPVNQYDLENHFIKNWKSQVEIRRVLRFDQSHISQVCLGKRKTAYGFIWKFKEDIDNGKS